MMTDDLFAAIDLAIDQPGSSRAQGSPHRAELVEHLFARFPSFHLANHRAQMALGGA